MRTLFLHGGGLDHTMWQPQLEALQGEFEVMAIDLPGHGERREQRFTFPAAVETVMDAIGSEERAVLVGLSLGGYVAIRTTAEHPERITGLVLTGCSVDYSRFGNRIVAATGEVFQRIWPKRMLREAQRSAFQRRYPHWPEGAEADQYWRGYADALRAARKIRWPEQLKGYPGQVLVLNGGGDKGHVREAEKLLAGVPHGRAQVIEGAGHLANLDRPEEYTAAVRDFLRSLS
jgi:pimeloyl-ACP methyl ester carboxylesterase